MKKIFGLIVMIALTVALFAGCASLPKYGKPTSAMDIVRDLPVGINVENARTMIADAGFQAIRPELVRPDHTLYLLDGKLGDESIVLALFVDNDGTLVSYFVVVQFDDPNDRNAQILPYYTKMVELVGREADVKLPYSAAWDEGKYKLSIAFNAMPDQTIGKFNIYLMKQTFAPKPATQARLT
jgi:hypothetical protein